MNFPPSTHPQVPRSKLLNMDNIPYLIFCGLSATFSFDDESEEGSSMMDFMNPMCCRDQGVETIFRPMTNEEFAERDEWSPPLYRDKSLLSSSSKTNEPAKEVSPQSSQTVDVIPYDQSPSSNRSTNDTFRSSKIPSDHANSIPSDFLPPRHSFSRTFDERDDTYKVPTVTSYPVSETRVNGLLPTDVLCGRGMNTSIHPGNVAFKKIIKKQEMQYICSKRGEKPKIALKLLEELRRNSVRFVKREKDDNGKFIWIDIGEQRAYEKVCQSLREGAPQLRRQMLSTQALQERQDNNTNKNHSYSMSSSTREGEEQKIEAPQKGRVEHVMPLYHSDAIPDARFEDTYYYRSHSYPKNMVYPSPPPPRGGSGRFGHLE